MMTGRQTVKDIIYSSLAVFCHMLLFSVYTIAHADNKEDSIKESPWGLSQLMAVLAKVDHSQANYREEKISRILKKPIILTGTLHYKSTGHIEKKVQKPFIARYVIYGDRLIIENDVEGRRIFKLQKTPAMWAFVESFRATLRGDLDTLRKYYTVEFRGTRNSWHIILTPLNKKMRKRVRAIHIRGQDAKIKRIVIMEVDGDQSRMEIY